MASPRLCGTPCSTWPATRARPRHGSMIVGSGGHAEWVPLRTSGWTSGGVEVDCAYRKFHITADIRRECPSAFSCSEIRLCGTTGIEDCVLAIIEPRAPVDGTGDPHVLAFSRHGNFRWAPHPALQVAWSVESCRKLASSAKIRAQCR